MGRHRTPEEKHELGERARSLRAAGRSCRQIQAELGIGKDLVTELLRGVPIPDRLARPRAKDDLRQVAVEMRSAGHTYADVAGTLGISKSTCSLWLRGVVVDQSRREDPLERGRRMSEQRWGAHRRQRDRASIQRKLSAALEVGEVDDRTLLLLGAVAYWCEGGKSKPWRPRSKFVFVNSDPLLVRLFVRWLRLVGVPPDRWVVRVQIHESADVPAAERYWSHVLGVDARSFGKTVLKRHRPLSGRRNTGADYHGCVSIYVRQGVPLLEQVEGWVVGALLGCGGELPARPMSWGGDPVAG